MNNRPWILLTIPALLLAVAAVVYAQQGMCPPNCACGCVWTGSNFCCADCGGSGGGGGEYPTPPPVEPPPSEPPPGGVPPTPTPEPDPLLDCFDCYPWAFCPDHVARACFLNAGSAYYLVSIDCMSSDQCDEEEPPPREPPVELPCVPTFDGNEFACEGEQWGYSINVRAGVPPARVQVRPFPRWVVGMGCVPDTPFQSGQPGSLTLQDYPRYTPPEQCAPNGPGFSSGCWSNAVDFPQRAAGEAPQEGDIRNYQIGLRWRRARSDQPHPNDIAAVPPVCWDFDERAWNIGQDFGCGPVPAGECGSTMVTHVYETSSWGKPTNGPNFVSLPCGDTPYCCAQVPEVWDNPAYQVRVYTTWAIEWRVTWEQYEVVDVEWEEGCRCEGWDYSGRPDWDTCEETPPDSCTGPGKYWLRHGTPVYEWVQRETPGGYQGWHAVDLRAFPGQATWYTLSYAVITTGAGAWCNYEYADPNPGDTVRVPVIEVQSVLVDDCVLTGTCPPGYPGAGPTPPPQTPPPSGPPPIEPTPCPPGVCP